MVIQGRIEPLDIPGLCLRVLSALRDDPGGEVVCDVAGVAADAVAIDALARLQLTAKRCGGAIRLRGAPAELTELLELTGLCEAVGGCLALEPGREPEQREDPLGVEEEHDPGDLPA